MLISILGDSHDNFENLAKAIAISNERGCELMLHTGDLVAPGDGAKVLSTFNGKVKFVFGNNDGDKFNLSNKFAQFPNLELTNGYLDEVIDGVRIFMNHYPKYSELAAKSGDYDLSIYGHTHEYHEEKIGECLLLNPSSIHNYQAESSLVLFDTKSRTIERIML